MRIESTPETGLIRGRVATLLPVLAVLSGVLGGLLLFRGGPAPTFEGTAVASPAPAPDFQLTDHHGGTYSLAEARGEVALLFFGFTSCPTVCPTALSSVETALSAVDDRAEVRVLFVTVDPARDDPPRLAAYLDRFGEGYLGLTGDPEVLRQVRAAYGARAEAAAEGSAEGAFAHTAALYGIDRQGRLRVVLGTDDPATIAADVETLLDL